MISYNQKLVISGNFFEFYQFQKHIHKDFQKAREDIEEFPEKIPRVITMTWHKSQFALTRSRRNIRRLINTNPALNKFLTLTFAENVCDTDIANYEFKKFVKRLKFHYPQLDLQYLAVIEFQKRGAVHYHMILDIPKINSKKLAELWGNGFIKINRIKSCDNLGAYVSKYLSKESTERLFNKKKFFYSRNLEKPKEFLDTKEIGLIKDFYQLEKMKPTFESTFENEHIGKVYYTQFKIKSMDI